ncbi:hypothetical protein ES703_123811 [subsurface metagenome]
MTVRHCRETELREAQLRLKYARQKRIEAEQELRKAKAEVEKIEGHIEERKPGDRLECPKCGNEMVPGYTAKTLQEFLQRERPDYWWCEQCDLNYEETETGKLRKTSIEEMKAKGK